MNTLPELGKRPGEGSFLQARRATEAHETMRRRRIGRAIISGCLILSALLLSADLNAQQAPTVHTVFMSAMEIKGSTSAEKLLPPSINPADLSKGYGFKAPGEADKTTPPKWEVSSYLFAPGSITVQRGDTVTLVVFVVNGDQHEVRVLAPDGQVVVPKATWHRGREYRTSFVAEKVGAYQLTCSTHAPTMVATILALPR